MDLPGPGMSAHNWDTDPESKNGHPNQFGTIPIFSHMFEEHLQQEARTTS